MIEGQRIILNDETVIEDGHAGLSGGFLWLYITERTMKQAAKMFIENPSKTAKIIFQYGEDEDTYEGYTECVHLSLDIDRVVSICLGKGEASVS